MKSIWTALITGYVILVVAIAINAVATAFGIKTWYGFFEERSIGPLDVFFLFGLYPVVLGLAGMLGVRLGRGIWERFTS